MGEAQWRRGRKLGRTLYKNEQCVGIVDDADLAEEIVEAFRSARHLRKLALCTPDAAVVEVARLRAALESIRQMAGAHEDLRIEDAAEEALAAGGGPT